MKGKSWVAVERGSSLRRASLAILLLSAFIWVTSPTAEAQRSSSGNKSSKTTKAKKPATRAKATAKPARNSGAKASANSSSPESIQRRALPQSRRMDQPKVQRSLTDIKPPRTNDFYEGGGKEAEYEKLLDQEIAALFKLVQKSKTSSTRGEMWLRLAERYVEKSRLVEYREQSAYDRRVKDYLDGRTRVKPRLDTTKTREYNRKAVQLYEWFLRDFPRDPKVDQALFFLGYNYFELGNTTKGEQYYQQLVRNYPDSVYVAESHFALGEFYFENEDWKNGFNNYQKVIQAKRARLASFAYYKAAWCLFRIRRTGDALKYLERVIRMAKSGEESSSAGGRRAINRIRLGVEALKDYVPFYAEVGDVSQAFNDFQRVAGDEKVAIRMLEQLAFIKSDQGIADAATTLFRQLISFNPVSERAAEYQYRIVIAYQTLDARKFREQLDAWLEGFGPGSPWYRENEKNQKLVSDMNRLQETTMRNHVLQLHQTAQNSRAPFSQKVAAEAYEQYQKYFSNSDKISEMQFFHAELMFDMGKYADAARLYDTVAERSGSAESMKYREEAMLNAVVAREKLLPSTTALDQRKGNSTQPIPLDPEVDRFEKSAKRYMAAYPSSKRNADIERRLAVLYYGFNQFDSALPIFEKILRQAPASKNGQAAGDAILSIYKARGDNAKLIAKAQEFLAIPAIAASAFGKSIRDGLEKTQYVAAQDLEKANKATEAAKAFEEFAASTKDAKLRMAARMRAGSNLEKSGDTTGAIRNFLAVLSMPAADAQMKEEQTRARNSLAKLYERSGQMELAAKQYAAYAQANLNNQTAVNGFYNAALIYDALGISGEAMKNYEAYRKYSRRADRNEVLFAIAEMFSRLGNRKQAINFYTAYLQQGGNSQSRRIESTFQIAEADRLAGRPAARRGFLEVAEAFKRAPLKTREETVRFSGESQFHLAQAIKAELNAVRFGTTDASQGAAAKQVKTLEKKYIDAMKEIIRLDHAPSTIAALASTGQLYELIAQKFERIPTPTGLSAEDGEKYRQLIKVEADRYKGEAMTSYRAAVERSLEFEIYTEWSSIARKAVAAADPKFQFLHDVVVDSNVADWMDLL
ncbi:MAG TPA: tetratricopeptide repeat protein [Pseudobdellovibrionaceae bacterium]|nr:tetratricopeptide repeat protein [Pseudobdellovibrionaceae bacterium]